MAITTSGRRSFEVSQGEFEAAVFGVIIVADGERDVDRIACQKLTLLHSFRHVPAQRIKVILIESQFSDLGSQLSVKLLQIPVHFGGWPHRRDDNAESP